LQDDYALSSYRRAQNAQKNGDFDGEIVPVEIPGARGAKATVVAVDEEASKVQTLFLLLFFFFFFFRVSRSLGLNDMHCVRVQFIALE
jgi:hypothetical protein